MDHSTKYLPCKDPSPGPRTHIKKPGMVVHACKPNTGEVGAETLEVCWEAA